MSDPQKTAPADKTKKARVLVELVHDGETRKPNDVISVTPEDEAALGGQIDTAPAAVKYAESLVG
jgi:hypothetical protein